MIKDIINKFQETHKDFDFNKFLYEFENGKSREELESLFNIKTYNIRKFVYELNLDFVKSRRLNSLKELRNRMAKESGQNVDLVEELESEINLLAEKNRKLYHSLTLVRDEANALRRESRKEIREILDEEQKERIIENSILSLMDNFKMEYKPKQLNINLEQLNSNTMNLYPYTDLHIGMLALDEVSGFDYDLQICKKWILDSFGYLLQVSPNTETCLIAEMGDLLHANDDSKETVSGHQLDVDSRHSKIIETAFEITIEMIEKALMKHKYVKFISISGNHSENSSHYLKAVLKAYFRNEPRVEIISGSRLVQYYNFGKCLLGFHHGHTIRSTTKLTECMISDNIDIFSNTKYRYWHIGHLHSNSTQVSKEDALCSIEIHKNLAPRDAWADGAGFRGNVGEVKAITYHKDYGEIGRNLFKVDMFDGDYK